MLIIGSVPRSSGIGGVTIHIQRLTEWLLKRDIKHDLCDYKTTNLINLFKTIKEHEIIHVHASNPILRILHIGFAKYLGKKTIFTVHGNVGRFGWFKNWLDKLSITWCDVPIVINHGSFEKSIKWNENTQLLPAYIPPLDEGTIPEYVRLAITTAKEEGKTVISTNASTVSYASDGKEIYGIHFLIDYFKDKPEYLLCISDPSGLYSDGYNGISLPNIILIPEQHSFYALMKRSDLMVRNTATDGDSLSVKEGLSLKLKVLATNCVDRPCGVILYEYNDTSSFELALQKAPPINYDESSINVVDALINIYHNLEYKKQK